MHGKSGGEPMTDECYLTGPYYFAAGDTNWECQTHKTDVVLRNPKRFGERGLRREDFRCPIGEPEMSENDDKNVYVQVGIHMRGECRWIYLEAMTPDEAGRFVKEDPQYRRLKPLPVPTRHLEHCPLYIGVRERSIAQKGLVACCCDAIRNSLNAERNRVADEIRAIRVHHDSVSEDYMRGMVDTRAICVALVKRENPYE